MARARKPFEGVRILVVDDEPAILSVFQRFLSHLGAAVGVAGGGEEGLAAIRRSKFDALVLDLRMPGTDGHRVYRALSQLDPALQQRTVVVSGDLSAKDRRLGIPPSRVLAKPVELQALQQVLAEVTGQAPRR